ncbi:MAG TPA: biotin--[acetyl-CoA-carboxylase] ligase [Opitutus sp.]|nr:biotin--[acetyl-CoA-carboxylase] ligase [Opitutus sp.]
MSSTTLLAPETTSAQAEGWTVHTASEIGSTNSAAARLPAWHAVRARVQTNGRGRSNRAWTSDEGGLWLSAVLPCPGGRAKWAILPLAAGWAIIGALKELGARDLRLRWPNDIMVHRRKLAGVLVERFNASTAVVGLGLNVFNFPESADLALKNSTTRLADLVPGGYTLEDLARLVLRAIGRAQAVVRDDRFRLIADELNLEWAEPRLVSVTLTGRGDTFAALFHGVDEFGRIRLTTERFGRRSYDASQVALLRELE